MQMLCAMLVFDAFEFGRPLTDISPWLDMQTNNRTEVVASLEAQEHRRFIKTHTPLDGVPFAEGVTLVCVARDPRDVALSFQHHWARSMPGRARWPRPATTCGPAPNAPNKTSTRPAPTSRA
jgi:aryl sulfotransferase